MPHTLSQQDRINELEERLWDAANELRANSKFKSSEYSVTVLAPDADADFVTYIDEWLPPGGDGALPWE
jgi:hypothetical protein